MAGNNYAGNLLLAQLQAPGFLFGLRQAFQVARFGISKDLNTFTREIGKKTGKRQTWAIDGGFPDFTLETERWPNQLELQRVRMPRVEFADRDKR
jgi:hypothetical protein